MARTAVRRLAMVAAILAVLAGCARNRVDKARDKAEKAVETALDAWSRGESPEKFANSNPSIRINDPDWKAGFRLLSSLTVDSKQSPIGPKQFECRVSLSLSGAAGRKIAKEVVYHVQMGDKTTIDRASP